MTSEMPKLLYISVVNEGERKSSFRYTRSGLQSTLQLMGCNSRHGLKISQRVFEVMKDEYFSNALPFEDSETNENNQCDDYEDKLAGNLRNSDSELLRVDYSDAGSSMPFELYKRLTTVVVSREHFLDVVCDALSQYKYFGPNQRADLLLACRIREKKESVIILLCGTSGCGKSTLSSLLGSRLGLTTVISTDSIRHMMRSFADEKQNPLLWASTYHAGECLDPVAVAKAKAKRKAKKLAGYVLAAARDEISDAGSRKTSRASSRAPSPNTTPGAELMIGKKQMAIEGYKAQSEMVIDSLDRLITAWEERKESVVVEGVHLSLNFVMGLMKKHPSIIPFMIYIANEDKHMERFAVRAKYMTLDPSKNKYIKYIRNIRTIQEYLCNRADKHLVPKVNNTNVDRSVAAIHATVFSCLRRRQAGEQLYDSTTKTVSVVHEEYRNHCTANSLSSKGMFQLIQRKGSSRHLMALLNTDGSVAKAWPVESSGTNRTSFGGMTERSVGNPMYGPLQIGKAEPVHLQFGNFGISAWTSDTGGTSYAGSCDETRGDGTDTGSRYFSSGCSSPNIIGGYAKELMEEVSVSGSEEDADEPPDDVDTDEDVSEREEKLHEEDEGSVDEGSIKSDEDLEELEEQDVQENGYWSDDEGLSTEKNKDYTVTSGREFGANNARDKYQHNLDLFLKLTRPHSCSLYGTGTENCPKPRIRTHSMSDSFYLGTFDQ